MTRIVAGTYGGRRLRTPAGDGTRPTSDRTREALFASLEATHDLTAGPFVDLYTGSGAVGLEALSRGAPEVVLVESDRRAAAVATANVTTLGVAARARVLGVPALRAASAVPDLRAATVFADPPYADPAADVTDVLTAWLAAGAVAPDAVVVVERAARTDWAWPDGLEALRDRRYGQTHLWYGRAL